MMKPTMQDVADYVGVSKSTVSQYLNHHYSYMSAATRDKIADAIKTLNYQPNQIAKSLKQKSTKIIALICAALSSRFSIHLISAVEAYFQKLGYTVVIARTDDDPDIEKALIESFISRQVDGIMVFPTKPNSAYYRTLAAQDFPIVFVDRYLPDVPIDSVLLDNPQAANMATNYLIANGHEQIAILTFPLGDHITTRVERLEGYQKALRDHQLPVVDDYIINCTRPTVPDHLNRLFALPQPPTALFLTNDMLLEDTLSWVRTTDRRIGQDLSIISLDDVSFARFMEPPITTISQPVADIGVTAADILLKKIRHLKSQASPVITRLSPTLHERESVIDIRKRLQK
ncbi:LacI family DNA-binding transcriptional regulator [Lacticaseibacillus sp. GG6-2]